MLPTIESGRLFAQTASDWWTDQFFGLDQDQRFVILILVIVFSAAIIIALAGIIGGALAGMHRRRLEADLKQDMLDRGMTAEEVARVIEAKPPETFLDRWAANQGSKKKFG